MERQELEFSMNIRAYTSDDFPTVEAWAKARDMVLIPQLLSPNGFLVEDEKGPLMTCWVYLVFDCPFVFIDNLYSRPNSSLKNSKAAWAMLWRTVKSFLSNLRNCNGEPIEYKLVRNFCRPEFARFAKKDGWHVADRLSIQVTYALP
jgi:hypothetical protein